MGMFVKKVQRDTDVHKPLTEAFSGGTVKIVHPVLITHAPSLSESFVETPHFRVSKEFQEQLFCNIVNGLCSRSGIINENIPRMAYSLMAQIIEEYEICEEAVCDSIRKNGV